MFYYTDAGEATKAFQAQVCEENVFSQMAPSHIYASDAFCFISWGDLFYVMDSAEQLSKPHPCNSRLTFSQNLAFLLRSLQPKLPRGAHPLGVLHHQGPPLVAATPISAWWSGQGRVAVVSSCHQSQLKFAFCFPAETQVKLLTQSKRHKRLRLRDQRPLKLAMWAQGNAKAHSITLTTQVF